MHLISFLIIKWINKYINIKIYSYELILNYKQFRDLLIRNVIIIQICFYLK